MNEILTLRDVLRYTKYDTETGVIILINDVLNLHLRPASIDQIEIVTNPNRTTVSLTTKLDQKITDDGGKLYIGDLLVTFDKMDVSKVYPGGFSVDSWMGLDSILMTLYSKTRVRINKDECDLIETQGLPVIRFKETSVFWRGDLQIHLADNPIINESPVGQLDGFEQPGLDELLDETTIEILNTELFNTIALLSAIYHNKTSH